MNQQGITDLQTLLSSMSPELDPQAYCFCTVDNTFDYSAINVFAIIKEGEGVTLILEVEEAKKWCLDFSSSFRKITLKVHSSLEAVGLTAAFSTALAEHQISANVVAGFYHDHIFVPAKDADKALQSLLSLTE